MNPESASSLLPWLIAALAVTLVAVGWLVLQLGRLGQRMDAQFAQQQLGLLRDIQSATTAASDRVIDLVAGEVDNLRDRLDAEQAASRQALQQLHLALVGQLGANKEETTLRLADLANAFASGQEKLRIVMLAETLKTLSEHARADRELLQSGLKSASEQLSGSFEALHRPVAERPEAISGHVNQRLDEGCTERDDVNFLKHTLAFRDADGTTRLDYSDVKITTLPPAKRVYGAEAEAAEKKEKANG